MLFPEGRLSVSFISTLTISLQQGFHFSWNNAVSALKMAFFGGFVILNVPDLWLQMSLCCCNHFGSNDLRGKAHSKYICDPRSVSTPQVFVEVLNNPLLPFSNIYEEPICALGYAECCVKQGTHMQTWTLLIRDIYNFKQAPTFGYTAREPDLNCRFWLQWRSYKVHHL